MVKSEEIQKFVAKSENAAVEFKRARGGVPADFWPSYSSFANTDGGVIILGSSRRATTASAWSTMMVARWSMWRSATGT